MRTPCYHPRIRLGRMAGLTGCPSTNRHLNHAFGQASFLSQRSFAPSTAAPQTRAQDCEKVLVWGVIPPARPRETVETLETLLSCRVFASFPQRHFVDILLTKSECLVLEFPSTT